MGFGQLLERDGCTHEFIVQSTEPNRRIVYRHEHPCNAEDIGWAVRSKVKGSREQFVSVYDIGEGSSRNDKTVPCSSQQSDGHIRSLEVCGVLYDIIQWKGMNGGIIAEPLGQ